MATKQFNILKRNNSNKSTTSSDSNKSTKSNSTIKSLGQRLRQSLIEKIKGLIKGFFSSSHNADAPKLINDFQLKAKITKLVKEEVISAEFKDKLFTTKYSSKDIGKIFIIAYSGSMDLNNIKEPLKKPENMEYESTIIQEFHETMYAVQEEKAKNSNQQRTIIGTKEIKIETKESITTNSITPEVLATFKVNDYSRDDLALVPGLTPETTNQSLGRAGKVPTTEL